MMEVALFCLTLAQTCDGGPECLGHHCGSHQLLRLGPLNELLAGARFLVPYLTDNIIANGFLGI